MTLKGLNRQNQSFIMQINVKMPIICAFRYHIEVFLVCKGKATALVNQESCVLIQSFSSLMDKNSHLGMTLAIGGT